MAVSNYTTRGSGAWCPVSVIAMAISPLARMVLTNGYRQTAPGDRFPGMAAMIDDEIVKVTNIAGNEIEIVRGCADTVPAAHNAGALIWFFDQTIGSDGLEYDGVATIGVKVLPTSGSGVLAIGSSPPNRLLFNRRFLRPYPPGNVMANGIPWFEAGIAVPEDGLVLTWAHRNRVSQGGTLLGHTAEGVAPEPGQTYVIRVFRFSGSTATMVRTYAGITGETWTYPQPTALADFAVGAQGRIELSSIRDVFESWQKYSLAFTVLPVAVPLGLGNQLGARLGGRLPGPTPAPSPTPTPTPPAPTPVPVGTLARVNDATLDRIFVTSLNTANAVANNGESKILLTGNEGRIYPIAGTYTSSWRAGPERMLAAKFRQLPETPNGHIAAAKPHGDFSATSWNNFVDVWMVFAHEEGFHGDPGYADIRKVFLQVLWEDTRQWEVIFMNVVNVVWSPKWTIHADGGQGMEAGDSIRIRESDYSSVGIAADGPSVDKGWACHFTFDSQFTFVDAQRVRAVLIGAQVRRGTRSGSGHKGMLHLGMDPKFLGYPHDSDAFWEGGAFPNSMISKSIKLLPEWQELYGSTFEGFWEGPTQRCVGLAEIRANRPYAMF